MSIVLDRIGLGCWSLSAGWWHFFSGTGLLQLEEVFLGMAPDLQSATKPAQATKVNSKDVTNTLCPDSDWLNFAVLPCSYSPPDAMIVAVARCRVSPQFRVSLLRKGCKYRVCCAHCCCASTILVDNRLASLSEGDWKAPADTIKRC